ncbi:MAG TPA: hypothetical protein VEX87_17450 [Skermanella sp.]|jgi:hypothetical protein|nr:hypothetical protein [Skermanella sp.]
MYASEPFFNFQPRRPVVPSWFRGLVVPFLLLLALPLSLLVLALMLGLFAARSLLSLFVSRPAPARLRPQRTADGAQILTDVDYVVLDDEKR